LNDYELRRRCATEGSDLRVGAKSAGVAGRPERFARGSHILGTSHTYRCAYGYICRIKKQLINFKPRSSSTVYTSLPRRLVFPQTLPAAAPTVLDIPATYSHLFREQPGRAGASTCCLYIYSYIIIVFV